MRDYELVVLVHPDLEIDLEKPLAKVRSIITDNGGKVTKEDNWGKRKLAYRINGQDFAVYVFMEVALPAQAVKKIQSTLNITDEALRFLLTAVDPRALAAAEAEKNREANEE
jgi:small subunit ribosomal protein S6